jgi:hypothetical protein
MPHTNIHIRRRAISASALLVLLAALSLAACGGSSSKSATSANATKTSSTPSTSGNRFAALRECLQKNGITLPQRPAGQRGGPVLPKGVTRAQFQAALQKCGGGGGFGGRNGQSARRRFGTPAFRKALTAYAACMNRNGVKLPAPDTSGNGPVFSSKGLNTASASFKAASAKCQSVLRNAFPRRPQVRQTAPRTGQTPPQGQPTQ